MQITPHSIKQEEAIFSDADITATVTGIQWGKALKIGTEVLTPGGYLKIEDITLDDILFDRDGKQTKIIGIYPQGLRDCYKITTTRNEIIVVDENHLNIVRDPHNRFEHVLTTKELFEKRWWKSTNKPSIPSVKPIDMEAKEFFISPYIMGTFLANGHMASSRFTTLDIDVVARVSSELPSCLEVTTGKGDQKKERRVKDNIKSNINRFKNELSGLNLRDKLSYTKFIPNEYKYSSIPQRLDLLRGMMDGDGTGGVGAGKKIEYDTTSLQLSKDVIWLVESLGGKAWARVRSPKYTYKGEKLDGRTSYCINIIMPFFNPFWTKVKAVNYKPHKHTTNKQLKSIEKCGKHETICFAVESKTKSFIIQNQIVTHNTFSGALWLRRLCHKYTSKKDNFIVAAPTYKIMRQSCLPAFMSLFGCMGKLNQSNYEFKINGGGTIFLRSGTEPDSVVGITRVRAVWGDEAGKYTKYFWENLEGRAAFANGRIHLTTSPYSLNWLYSDLAKPHLAGKRPDVKLIGARSVDNPYFNEAVYHKRKKTMDPRMFKAMYDGSFEQMQGLVYCFDEEEHVFPHFIHTEGIKYYAGVDWGFTDPFVILVMAVTPNGDCFLVNEFYKASQTYPDMLRIAKNLRDTYNIQIFFCDPSQPGYIASFQGQGINAIKAENDILQGIGVHYQMLKEGRFKLIKGACPQTQDEYNMYHWPEPQNLLPDQNAKPQKPVDQNNHCLAEGTKITTSRGLISIENVKVGDSVLTREGYKKVLNNFDNGMRSVMLVNNKLLCTEEHIIWTTSGWVRSVDLQEFHKTLELNQSLMAKLIIDILTPATFLIGIILKRLLPICIEMFGFITMDLSKKVFTYTISMVTRVIIESKILKWLMDTIMYQSILKKCTKMKNSRKREKYNFLRCKKKLRFGMHLKKAINGIRSITKNLLAKSKKLKRNVKYVALNIKQNVQPGAGFVQINVGHKIEEMKKLTMLKINALFAKKFFHLVNTTTKLHAQQNVRVYDIEVENKHEFFANGVLVHNSMDALRYLSMGTRDLINMRQPTNNSEGNNTPISLNPNQRIARVKRKRSQQYERFS